MTAAPAGRAWDVFVSYARNDELWVRTQLYPALMARFREGRPPRVFLDVGPDGLPAGSNWHEELAYAVQHSRFFLPVYSRNYFASAMCRWELGCSMRVHADDGRLIPVVIDPAVEVPFAFSHINWTPITVADWLDRICLPIGLSGHRARPQLRFRTTVGDVRVNHTLPEQQIEIVGHTAAHGEEEVTLDAGPAGGSLHGTLTAATSGGVATFRDLSFDAPATDVHLVARYPGGEPARSTAFSVLGSRPRPTGRRGTAAVWFLDDSRTVAALDGGMLGVRTPDGDRSEPVAFDDAPRQWIRWSGRAVIAGWSGLVAVVGADGRSATFRLGEGFAVPGALCPHDDRLYVGMWSGAVFALDPETGTSEPVFHHPAGVQAMTVVGGRLLIVGFDGMTAWYTTAGEPTGAGGHRLEPVVWGLRAGPGCVIAAGAERVHRLDVAGDGVDSLRLLAAGASGALVEGALTAVHDADGQGVRFDTELEVRAAFRAPAGARPVDTNAAGDIMVAAHPDGSHALLVDDRVVHVHREGPMAVSPDGSRVALLGPSGVTTMPVESLLRQ